MWLEASVDLGGPETEDRELDDKSKGKGKGKDAEKVEDLWGSDALDNEELRVLGQSLFPDMDPPEENESGPSAGPSTHRGSNLELAEDALEYEDTPVEWEAGAPIEMMGALKKEWLRRFPSGMDGGQSENRFKPFKSKMDWEIASWGIRDSSSHSAFD
jgi:hypothetical protein